MHNSVSFWNVVKVYFREEEKKRKKQAIALYEFVKQTAKKAKGIGMYKIPQIMTDATESCKNKATSFSVWVNQWCERVRFFKPLHNGGWLKKKKSTHLYI